MGGGIDVNRGIMAVIAMKEAPACCPCTGSSVASKSRISASGGRKWRLLEQLPGDSPTIFEAVQGEEATGASCRKYGLETGSWRRRSRSFRCKPLAQQHQLRMRNLRRIAIIGRFVPGISDVDRRWSNNRPASEEISPPSKESSIRRSAAAKIQSGIGGVTWNGSETFILLTSADLYCEN